MRRWIVAALERGCDLTHWVTHHRPWLWLPQRPGGVCVHCPLADVAYRLDQRWGTEHWGPP